MRRPTHGGEHSERNFALLDISAEPKPKPTFKSAHGNSHKNYTPVTTKPLRSWWPAGWRGGVASGLVVGLTTLCVNIVVTIWALKLSTPHESDSVVTLKTFYKGSCSTSKNITTIIHLLLNIASSLLLGASNYCMQILSAPQRQEIDRAHSARRWMYIGVPNMKNVLHIPWTRRILWIVLLLSSLPLHMLWNSAFVQTIPHNNYHVGAVTQEFESGAPLDYRFPADCWHHFNNETERNMYFNPKTYTYNDPWYGLCQSVSEVNATQSSFEEHWVRTLQDENPIKLSAEDCILEYGGTFVPRYRNLALVMDYENSTNSLIRANTFSIDGLQFSSGNMSSIDPFTVGWPCSGEFASTTETCGNRQSASKIATAWMPYRESAFSMQNAGASLNSDERTLNTVQHCLAQKVDSPCRVSVTPPILYVVIVANTLKVICFAFTLRLVGRTPKTQPLVTNGDAIKSFIRKPDHYLKNRSLYGSINTVKNSSVFWDPSPPPLQWRCLGYQWWRGAPTSLRLFLFVPAITGLITTIVFYSKRNMGAYLSVPFGGVSTSTLGGGVNAGLGLLSSTLAANSTQLVLSSIYFAYNATFTSILAHAELLRFSLASTLEVGGIGLRVSCPQGKQRSTYYLQLPYRFVLPLMALSTLLHWLVSQSLFLVRVAVYRPDGVEDPNALISTVGYSPIAVLVTIIIIVVMLVAIVVAGLVVRYPGTMPLAATCSASMAAICQVAIGRDGIRANDGGLGTHEDEDVLEEDEYGIETEKLMWGCVGTADGCVEVEDGETVPVKHATFSNRRVEMLITGETYV